MSVINLDPDLFQQLEQAAAARQCSPQDLIRTLLDAPNGTETPYPDPLNAGNRYIKVLENAFDFVAIHQPADGKLLYITPVFAQIFGYGLDDLRDKPADFLVHPDDKGEKLAQAHRRALSGESITNVQYRMRHKDGHYLWLETYAIPVLDEAGQVIQIMAASRDITEQKQMQTRLEANECFLSTLFNGVQSSIFVVELDENDDFRYKAMNPAHLQATGLCEQDVIGKRPEELPGVSAEQAAQLRANYQRCVDAGEAITYEQALAVNGRTLWWTTQITPLRDDAGRINCLIGFSLDITEQKAMRAALEESEQFLSTIFNGVQSSVFVVDVDEKGDFWLRQNNPANKRALGLPGDAYLNKRPQDMPELAPELATHFVSNYQRCVELGTAITYEEHLPIGDSERHWTTQLTPLKNDNGRVERIIGFSLDITDQKQTQAALEKSERFLSAIYDNTQSSIFVINVDEDGDFRFGGHNPAHARAVKLRSEDIEGKRLDEVNHISDDTIASIRNRYQQCVATGEPLIYEEAFQADERTTYWTTQLTPLRNAQGRIDRIVGFSLDVTEQKQMQAALEKSERFLSAIFENTQTAIFVVDVEADGVFRFTGSNPACKRLFGLQDVEYLNRRPQDVPSFTPAQAAWFQDNFRQCAADGDAMIYEENLTLHGRTLHLTTQLTPLKNKHGRVYRIIGFMLDTTLQRQMLQSLRQSEQRFRQLVELSPDAISLFTVDGRLLMVNAQNATLNGYDSVADAMAAADGLTVYDFVAPNDIERFRADVEHVAATGETCRDVEYEIYRGDGSTYPAGVSLAVLPGSGEQRLTAIVRDLTPRKAAEAQALAFELEQERRNILASFLQDTAHEFRTPLATISTSLYLLNKKDDPEHRQKYTERIETQVARLVNLVDEMRLMTELDIERKWTMEPVPLNGLLNLTATKFAAQLGEQVITLMMELPPTSPVVRAESDKLNRAFEEVLRNAVQYTPKGGAIRVRALVQGGDVTITISDNGVGMSPKTLERVFQRFFRADTAHTIAGFGLGLPIARQIIKRHRGSIDVDSTLDVGTTVTITLPVM